LAKDISVPPRRIDEIVHGKRSISADMALRTNLQSRYDLEIEKDRLGGRLAEEVQTMGATG